MGRAVHARKPGACYGGVPERSDLRLCPPTSPPTARQMFSVHRSLHGDALKLCDMTYVALTLRGMLAQPSPYPPNLVSIGYIDNLVFLGVHPLAHRLGLTSHRLG